MKVSKSLIFFDVDTVSFNLADLNQLHILSSEESLWRCLALEEGLMMAPDSILGLFLNPNSFFTPNPNQDNIGLFNRDLAAHKKLMNYDITMCKRKIICLVCNKTYECVDVALFCYKKTWQSLVGV